MWTNRMQCLTFQSTLPRTGSDVIEHKMKFIYMRHFNPRSPARGATQTFAVFPRMILFQSTLPRTGSDRRSYKGFTPDERISIHAPPHGERPGKTYGSLKYVIISIHAPPHGERPGVRWAESARRKDFNPRSPARGATGLFVKRLINGGFNPRSPARGATRTIFSSRPYKAFQSTLPRTGSDTES